jgi:hypothetical protein
MLVIVQTSWRRFSRATVLTSLTFLTPLTFSSAQQPELPEAQAKAGFLYNIAKLTEWPATAFATTRSPLVIGVLGKDPVYEALEKFVAGKSLDGRKLVVLRYDSVAQIKDCHVLFVSASAANDLPQVFRAVRGRSVLTVGDSAQFTKGGGMIQLVKIQDSIRMKINMEAATSNGLKLSSKLLRLATIVGEDDRVEKAR